MNFSVLDWFMVSSLRTLSFNFVLLFFPLDSIYFLYLLQSVVVKTPW